MDIHIHYHVYELGSLITCAQVRVPQDIYVNMTNVEHKGVFILLPWLFLIPQISKYWCVLCSTAHMVSLLCLYAGRIIRVPVSILYLALAVTFIETLAHLLSA